MQTDAGLLEFFISLLADFALAHQPASRFRVDLFYRC
jgi:hypothetical protein